MQRTIRIKLNTTDEQAASLRRTAELFTESFNAVCVIGWNAKEKNGVRLHHLTYRASKLRAPSLVSDLHIQARVRATEAVRSALALARKGRKAACPRSAFCPPRYNCHTLAVDWVAGIVRLSTVGGRLAVSFILPAYFKSMTTGKVCAADLIKRRGCWWLHVAVELLAPKVRKRKACLGVDLGLNRPAVTSDARFLGDRAWKNIEARIFRQKRSCQAKGTQASRRKLRRVCGRQARFRRDCDHVLSRRIVAACPPGGTIVLENLTDIHRRVKTRKRQRRRLHGWSFAQLKGFVAYKAEANGSRVVFIDPRHTSQCCSHCGHIHRSNRRSQSAFKCRRCGFALNADLNGARNIRAKHLGTFGIALRVRPLSTGPTSRQAQCGRPPGAACKPSR